MYRAQKKPHVEECQSQFSHGAIVLQKQCILAPALARAPKHFVIIMLEGYLLNEAYLMEDIWLKGISGLQEGKETQVAGIGLEELSPAQITGSFCIQHSPYLG